MALNTRITHALGEVLRDGDPSVRITQAVVETLREGDPDVRITHAVVEILREYVPCDWFVEDVEIINWIP